MLDDWVYGLFHSPDIDWRVATLGRQFDLLRVVVGDCDRSFSVQLHRDGSIVRRFIVESPSFEDQIITHDFGPALAGEEALLGAAHPDVWAVPEALGIEVRPSRLSVSRWLPATK